MGEVKVESHNMGPTFSWLASLSLHVNWASYSWFTTFQYLTLKIEGQGHGWGHNMGLTSYWLISLSFPVNQPSHSWDKSFSKFDLENPGSRSNDHVLRNYRSGQFHRTSNGINPYSGFRDIGSANSGPSAQSFWPMVKPIWGKWANNWHRTTTGLDKSMKL